MPKRVRFREPKETGFSPDNTRYLRLMKAEPSGSDDETTVAAIIDRTAQHAGAVIDAITRSLIAEIPELSGDVQSLKLLHASTAGNVETVLDALRYGIDIDRVEPPTAALEYARRLAQRGTPASALVRAYRLGHQEMLTYIFADIRESGIDPVEALSTYEAISGVTFRYIDWISMQVIVTYEAERERWLNNRNSIRAIRVRELLADDDDVDIDAATAAIRYPLCRIHLALTVWLSGSEATGGELVRLERFLGELATMLALRTTPLFVAADQVSGWGWLALEGNDSDDIVDKIKGFVERQDETLRIAIGTPGAGLTGFRRSHEHAQQVHRVAILGSPSHRAIAAGDAGVSAVALLAENPVQAHRWITETLGQLAASTANDARLRETLQVFLHEGASYKAAAGLLNLHHNTVKYRVDRAVERRGRPITDDRLDVELALLARHLLGEPPSA